jgi:hypothetical protein
LQRREIIKAFRAMLFDALGNTAAFGGLYEQLVPSRRDPSCHDSPSFSRQNHSRPFPLSSFARLIQHNLWLPSSRDMVNPLP